MNRLCDRDKGEPTWGPGSPRGPLAPGIPTGPGGPLSPWAPGFPCFPGGPWKHIKPAVQLSSIFRLSSIFKSCWVKQHFWDLKSNYENLIWSIPLDLEALAFRVLLFDQEVPQFLFDLSCLLDLVVHQGPESKEDLVLAIWLFSSNTKYTEKQG